MWSIVLGMSFELALNNEGPLFEIFRVGTQESEN